MQSGPLVTPRERLAPFLAPAIFAALTLIALHAVLFQLGKVVLAADHNDLVMQFLPWRDFGFGQIERGNFPLWNPYIYGGAPYFAGFQSALLYPPNWLHLLLPLITAINWIIATQLFGAGYCTYLWCRGRSASIPASILAGIMFMFSGPYFLHIYAGHLANLCVMIWTPLLFLAIDRLNESGSLHWCLLGVVAVTLQILGGHPQYLYYSALISFLYVLISLFESRHRLRLLGGFFIIFVGASMIAAVQLLAGLQAAGESVRSSGTDYVFASMFALPPENLLTIFAPEMFGKLHTAGDPADAIDYFGRCYLWEMSVFISISGLLCAGVGMIAGWRKTVWLTTLMLVTLILALGRHLPIYRPLYLYFPEYSHFRSVSKFTFLTVLFLCVEAAAGWDLLWNRANVMKPTAWAAAGVAAALALLALVLYEQSDHASGTLWTWMLAVIQDSKEAYISTDIFQHPDFIKISSTRAAECLLWAAGTAALLSVVLLVATQKRAALYGLIVLSAIELLIFAQQNTSTLIPQSYFEPEWLSVIRSATGDFRVVNAPLPNGDEMEYLDQGMSLGIKNLWGYDPGVLKRYAETIATSQGLKADDASQYIRIGAGSLGLFQMLRCKFALILQNQHPAVEQIVSPLPVAQLVPHWVVEPKRDAALAMVNAHNFDPRKTAVLESPPGISESQDAPAGPADVVQVSTDILDIRTTTASPTLLLVTNNYSAGWRAIALEDSSQQDYQILPANHTLMAIPLQPGAHHIRMEYLPTAFVVGKWISLVALLLFLGIFSWWGIKRRPAR